MILRYEHQSDILSDLYNERGQKIGSIVEQIPGKPVLYTSSLQVTVPGLLQIIEAMQSRRAEYEYGS